MSSAHSKSIQCLLTRNTSAPGSPHPAPNGGTSLIPVIKGKGLVGCQVQDIKGDQAPRSKSKDVVGGDQAGPG